MAKTANFKIYNGTSWEELTFPPSSHNHDSAYLKIATAKREYASLIPYGTQIPASIDLNTTTYIKVGNYYCSANTTVKTLTNCPTTKAFMMQVLSPLATTIDNETTKTYVYRLRKLQTYTGEEYIQYVSSGATAGTFTYGAWKQTARTADLSGYAALNADNEFEGQIYCISDIYSESKIHAEGSIISDYEIKTENTDGHVNITPGIVDITFSNNSMYLSAEEDLYLINDHDILHTGNISNYAAAKTQGTYYVVGNTTGTAGTWTGTNSDITSLYAGLTIAYKIGIAGVSTGTTLNINNLGAKAVKRNDGNFTTHIPVNSVVILVYDGTYWRWADYDSTNIYQLRKYYGSHIASTVIYRYQILLTQKDNKVLPINTTSNSTATTKTLTTSTFDPFGAIYFYNYTSTVNAGAAPTTTYLYKQILADLRYSFNTGQTLTANKPVYMVCVLQSDGTFKLNDNSCITQSLPTSDDSKYYIYLGQAYDTYRIELSLEHPIYYYYGDKIRLYTGIKESEFDTTYVKLSSVDDSSTYNQSTGSNIPTKTSVAGYVQNYAATTSHTHSDYASLSIVTSLPTPTEEDRGKLMILAGTTTDELYICLKISNAYTWVKMSSEDAIYNSLLNNTYGN